ncbi:transcription factor FAMA [Cicer arietinum]|uniref:Transcription factor FAMA n=1 Tax=Cicer arietinum TaxID=3827 RepID=A0A1S2XL31_CICAR|nr:transcription factor FAMA [Cicer arietinum]XP_004490292.1 transcription factor FAMA [Cicer arietinum]
MEKDNDFSAPSMPSSFNTLDYSIDHHHQQQQQQQYEQLMKYRIGEETSCENNNGIVDYMPQTGGSSFYGSNSFDKLSFADVMQFADFGPKLALNRGEEPGIDPVYFLKFPVLNNKMENQNTMLNNEDCGGGGENNERLKLVNMEEKSREDQREETRVSEENNSVQQMQFNGEQEEIQEEKNCGVQENNKKRKRPRTVKTSEEVESQRMTHIAVERNRRKQMNEHLRVLRSLMPGSYVQRGDQASIIGGAIEFVRELEQLLQCLESQKRRRQVGDSSLSTTQQQPPFFPATLPLPNDHDMKLAEMETPGLHEETAESKTCLADVEVKLLGFDAMIKILSRRRPGQLIKTIAALEDMQLLILHTNITTIEQTVLYSFNVKVASDTRLTAEDIATSVQQILSFIHTNTSM